MRRRPPRWQEAPRSRAPRSLWIRTPQRRRCSVWRRPPARERQQRKCGLDKRTQRRLQRRQQMDLLSQPAARTLGLPSRCLMRGYPLRGYRRHLRHRRRWDRRRWRRALNPHLRRTLTRSRRLLSRSAALRLKVERRRRVYRSRHCRHSAWARTRLTKLRRRRSILLWNRLRKRLAISWLPLLRLQSPLLRLRERLWRRRRRRR